MPSDQWPEPQPEWSEAEDLLRDALRSFAESVHVPSDAYGPVSGRWLRDSHHRKVMGASPVLLVLVVAMMLALCGRPDLPSRPVELILDTNPYEGDAIAPHGPAPRPGSDRPSRV